MSCCQCQGIEGFFAGKIVARELKSYRRDGPASTTRTLIDAIRANGVEGATLLDIGGGVGAIQHELLGAGVGSVTSADAATAYLEAARQEAERRGYAGRVTYVHGDFVDLAPDLEPADIVTLDRVICCYHDVQSLVGLSLGKARRIYGLVYPRDTWWNKIGFRVLNALLLIFRKPFRVFVHPAAAVDAMIRGAGFERRFYRRTLIWQVAVYSR